MSSRYVSDLDFLSQLVSKLCTNVNFNATSLHCGAGPTHLAPTQIHSLNKESVLALLRGAQAAVVTLLSQWREQLSAAALHERVTLAAVRRTATPLAPLQTNRTALAVTSLDRTACPNIPAWAPSTLPPPAALPAALPPAIPAADVYAECLALYREQDRQADELAAVLARLTRLSASLAAATLTTTRQHNDLSAMAEVPPLARQAESVLSRPRTRSTVQTALAHERQATLATVDRSAHSDRTSSSLAGSKRSAAARAVDTFARAAKQHRAK